MSAMASSPSGPSSSDRSARAAKAAGGCGRSCRTTSSRLRRVPSPPTAAARSSNSRPASSASSTTSSAGRSLSSARRMAASASRRGVPAPVYRTAIRRRSASRASSAAKRVFPMPRGPRDEHHAAAPLARVGQQRDQLGQLPVPARQQRGATVECRRQLLRAGRRIERGVLREDRGLQPSQLCARLDADLLDQRAARHTVGLERLRLPAAAVQSQHQLAMQVLAKRLLSDSGLQFGHQIRVPADRQLRFDARLERRPTPLLQAGDLGLRKRLIGKVGERRTAPEAERLPQRLGRAPPGPPPSRPGPAPQAPRSGRYPAPPARRSAGTRSRESRAARCDRAPAATPTPGCEASCGPSPAATLPTTHPPADRSRPTRWPAGSAGPAGRAVAPYQSKARGRHRRRPRAGQAGESPKLQQP